MSVNPQDIQLRTDQRQQLAELADRAGCTWEEVLNDALAGYQPHRAKDMRTGRRSFLDVMREDGAIGVVQSGLPCDLSTNPEHLNGFGHDHEAGSR